MKKSISENYIGTTNAFAYVNEGVKGIQYAIIKDRKDQLLEKSNM